MKKSEKKRIIVNMRSKAFKILVTVVIFVLSFSFVSRLSWSQLTTLFINPSTTTVLVGDSFTISIDVADIDDLAGYNIYVRYNTTVLTATQTIVDNTWFTAEQQYTVWANQINDLTGIVHVSVTLAGAEQGVSGSGDLFRIAFRGDNSGYSLLDIYNDGLVDALFSAIPHSTTDGIAQATVHDVAVNNVVTTKTIVAQGSTLRINVTAVNEGDYTETFDVRAFANNTLVESQTITLDSKSYTTLTFTWNTTGFARGNYTITAYASSVSSEVDTVDNTSTDGSVLVTIPGDVNGDRTVNVFDILKIKYHRSGPPSGPGGYDPNVDINSDGFINVFDILIAKAHLGQAW